MSFWKRNRPMKFLKIILLLCIGFSSFAQVILKKELILSAQDSASRTVTGIAYPEGPFNAANSISLANGSLIYAPATGINSLVVNLNPAVAQYTQGMVINFSNLFQPIQEMLPFSSIA